MIRTRLLLAAIMIVLFIPDAIFAQDTLIIGSRKALRKQRRDMPPEKGDIFIVAMPIIGYNPSNGLMVGAGATGSFFMGDPSNTGISSAITSLNFTSKKQLLFTLRSTVFTGNNNLILNGDWRYLDSSQPTYGLGTGPSSSKLASNGFEVDDGVFSKPIDDAQLMLFKQIRFYETVYKKTGNNLFLGFGYHLDIFKDIEDQLLDTIAEPPVITGYYMYNQKYGFSQERNALSGISFNVSYDTRDNQNNAYRGQYINLSFHVNPQFLGSNKNSTTLYLEYRRFLDLTKDHHNMLCFWGIGNFVTSGTLPALDLPAIGEDQYGKSGRGYTQGRFRGQSLIYAEAEYRRHLIRLKRNPDFLGAVLFANAVTATNKDAKIGLFEYINTGLGAGLRIMISRKARTNLGIDYGLGNYGSSGFYLKLNETF